MMLDTSTRRITLLLIFLVFKKHIIAFELTDLFVYSGSNCTDNLNSSCYCGLLNTHPPPPPPHKKPVKYKIQCLKTSQMNYNILASKNQTQARGITLKVCRIFGITPVVTNFFTTIKLNANVTYNKVP